MRTRCRHSPSEPPFHMMWTARDDPRLQAARRTTANFGRHGVFHIMWNVDVLPARWTCWPGPSWQVRQHDVELGATPPPGRSVNGRPEPPRVAADRAVADAGLFIDIEEACAAVRAAIGSLRGRGTAAKPSHRARAPGDGGRHGS